jgi:Ca-activated chloride channel family protein
MTNLRQAKMECESGREPMLLGVKASGAVKGRLLLMTLEQRYRNTGSNNAEITYTFPLPQGPNGGAVLMDVEVDINGKVLKGEVTPKNTARAQYEEAISEGNTSILLERNYDGSFTLELGNLMAGEECKILIRYAQTLSPEHGQIRMMLPTTIAPRYGNPVTQGRLQPHQVPVTDSLAEYPFDITVVLFDDMAYSNVSSPSHKTSFYRNGNDLVIKLAQRGYLDRDFILIFSNLKSESVALAGKDFYQVGQHAMIASFCPQFEASGSKTLNAKILVDCSSSMSGDSIDAARRALEGFVQGITKEDKFSLSRFGDSVEHRSRGMWSGTGQAKASAMRWIEGVHANMGGTEMASALMSTIAISDNGKGDILLITDGEIEGIDEVIQVATNSKHRIFVVAIGSSPAEGHLRRLATATGGYCDFLAPGEKVAAGITRMFSRMRAPRIKNLRVKWPNSLRTRWEQKVQSYAFENDVLHVCAFVDTPEDLKDFTSVKLWGQVDDSENDVLMSVAPLNFTESSTNILARMTANAQYAELCGDGGRAKNSANAPERLDLAVTYRLITDETNFILVHERADSDKATEMPGSHKVPQMLPGGWGGTGSVVRSSASPKLRMLRTGTDNMPFNAPIASAFSHSSGIGAASVWHTNRTQAATKVDALSASGMDDFDIPAFLRKRADVEAEDLVQPSVNSRNSIDKSNPQYWKANNPSVGKQLVGQQGIVYVGITPAGLERWLSLNHSSFWPSTYADLRDLGLGLSICEWLEFEIGPDRDEQLVVASFLNSVRGFRFAVESTLIRSAQAVKSVLSLVKTEEPESEMESEIRLAMIGVGPQTWPIAVVSFPEECC